VVKKNIIHHTSKPHGKERTLEQDTPRNHHCAYRHRHHLRRDIVHGHVRASKKLGVSRKREYAYSTINYNEFKKVFLILLSDIGIA
jgi:hypothetical protein